MRSQEVENTFTPVKINDTKWNEFLVRIVA